MLTDDTTDQQVLLLQRKLSVKTAISIDQVDWIDYQTSQLSFGHRSTLLSELDEALHDPHDCCLTLEPTARTHT